MFFYLYAVSEILAIFLDSAIIPTYSGAYEVSLRFLEASRVMPQLTPLCSSPNFSGSQQSMGAS